MNDSSCAQVFELLSQYLDHELTPPTCEQLEAHLSGCPECVEVVESLRRSLELCRRFGSGTPAASILPDDMARLRDAYRKMLAKRGSAGENPSPSSNPHPPDHRYS